MFGRDVAVSIESHALAEYPKECCGVVSGGVYVPLRNVALDPFNHFQLPVLALIEYAPVDAIVHSHCGPMHGREPSPADYANQKITRVAVYGLVWTDGENASDIVWFGDGDALDRPAWCSQG